MTYVDEVNNNAVSAWYDINPLAQNPFNVTSSSTARPLYIENSTNGLPALRFDGVNDKMSRTGVIGSALTKGDQITIFLVQKYHGPAHNSSAFHWGGNQVKLNLHAIYGSDTVVFDFNSSDAAGFGANSRIAFAAPTYADKTNILTAVRRPNNSGEVRINGTQYGSSALSEKINILESLTFNIAHNSRNSIYENADIYEIIIFKTALKASEVIDIEQYLSNKWGVKLNGL